MAKPNPPSAARYTLVAILLHWAIAAAIVVNLLLGWWMHEAIEDEGTQTRAVMAYQLHKSIGLTVLALSLLRFTWRLLHPVPRLPAAMAGWEKLAAKAVHWAFYVLMIAIPLSGWLYVSAQWRNDAPLNVPTLWFGLFEVPHLFGLDQAAHEARAELAARFIGIHELLTWAMSALLALHIAAALKHHFINRDVVLTSMLPAVPPRAGERPLRDPTRSFGLRTGGLVILAAGATLAWALLRTPEATDTGAASISDLPGSTWSVEQGSEIFFGGEHAGTPFEGRFTRWQADIRFDPAQPERSSIVAQIETGSARDGDSMHEETLPETEWFDVANHPTATFRSTAISVLGEGQYALQGTLRIKDRDLVLTPLTLAHRGDQLRIEGKVMISRREANLGMESDPNAEFVSDEIPVTVKLTARKRPG